VGEANALGIAVDEAGLCLRALNLWLDPVLPTSAAFVSHAHGCAARDRGRTFASRETLALLSALAPARERSSAEPSPDLRPLDWEGSIELPIAAPFGGGTARLSLAPAGHLLGAAQLVVDHPRGRLVYTGDFSTCPDRTHAQGAAVPCDEIVVTSTFALPIFRFAPHEQTLSAVAEWCERKLAAGVTPVVLAQNPGPAQSIVRELGDRGVPVAAHDDVRRACAAYEALGVRVGDVRPVVPDAREAARVIAAGTRAADVRGRLRAEVAYASGWALLDAAVEQKRADAAFALADHADYDDLVALVEQSGARRVHVSRGDARPFARLLRGRGLDADALDLGAIDERGAS
jgi:Cft2 family RNA processing exonuclease